MPHAPRAPLASRGSAERPRQVVLAGGGRVGCAVAARLPLGWSLVVIDVDPRVRALVAAVRPDAAFVEGDASSRLVLARCGLDARSVFIAATNSDEVNREAAALVQRQFGVQERVVVVAGTEAADERVDAAECVQAAQAIAGRVVNRVSIEAARAVDIGLGEGEILQVTVLDGSPAVGRPLREFSARHWLVAAVYRSGALIVPHGDTRVAAGDRVLLVGDPADLQDVAPFFRGGAPVFPSQYGSAIAWLGPASVEDAARAFADRVGAEPVLPVPLGQLDLAAASVEEWRAWLDAQAIGCVVVQGAQLPAWVRLGLARSRLHAAIVGSRRPFLLVRGAPRPVTRLLVGLRDARAQREVLLAAIDLARLLEAGLEVLTVGDALEGEDPVGVDVARLARTYGVAIAHRRVPGNPVQRLREAAAEVDLVVLGLRVEHNRLLAPDVSTHLLHELPSSALFVPWSSEG